MLIFSYCSTSDSSKKIDPSLVNDLKQMIDDHNVLAKTFRRVHDHFEMHPSNQFALWLFRNHSAYERTYNTPTVDDALIVGDFDSSKHRRDIIVHCRSGEFQRLYEMHTAYITLQYPLLFRYGKDGYQEEIPFRSTSKSCLKRVQVSMHEFIAYRIQDRANEEGMLLLGWRLFQQFVIDCYSMVESQQLSYIQNN